MAPSTKFWTRKSVFVTGHTGFKGSWLSLWLSIIGAKVHGYALNPTTQPNLFDVLHLRDKMASDTRSNVNEFAQLRRSIEEASPEIVFHLAAQPLVRYGYLDPLNTFLTNAIGTAHLLEAARCVSSIKVIIVVTTDKVYENSQRINRFKESDRLGGYDPYSASKVAAEIISHCYKQSYFNNGPNICTVRAGNIIGGGDWSADRLVPDCIKAFSSNQPVLLRFPSAVRPWQYVLDPLFGYLILAEKLFAPCDTTLSDSYNFGPKSDSEINVEAIADRLSRLWGNRAKVVKLFNRNQPHETRTLRLNSSKAKRDLGWVPRINLATTLAKTVDWYRHWSEGADMLTYSSNEIREYIESSHRF